MFDRLNQMISNWRVTVQTAHQLSRLSDAQLSDIGINRQDIPEIIRRLQKTA